MEEKMSICPHCGGNACYEQVISEEVTQAFALVVDIQPRL